MTESDKILTITRLPDGRFTLSADPARTLSKDDLRRELGNTISRPDVVEDLIQRATGGNGLLCRNPK